MRLCCAEKGCLLQQLLFDDSSTPFNSHIVMDEEDQPVATGIIMQNAMLGDAIGRPNRDV